MTLTDLHDKKKSLSVVPLKRGGEGTLISIRLQEGGELPDHKTTEMAVLIVVSGEIIYKSENGKELKLNKGEYVVIEANVIHSLTANSTADLLLMK